MCIFGGTSGGAKNRLEKLEVKTTPPQEENKYGINPPLTPSERAEKEIHEAMKKGPAPTVLDSSKSSFSLSARRRQLIDAFKYGLAGTSIYGNTVGKK